MRFVRFIPTKNTTAAQNDMLSSIYSTKLDTEVFSSSQASLPSILSQALDTTSVVFGTGNIVLSANSFSSGSGNTVSGNSSFVYGINNISSGDNNYIFGSGNTASGTSISIMGSNDVMVVGDNVAAFGLSGVTLTGNNTVYIQNLYATNGTAFFESGCTTPSITGSTNNNIIVNSPSSQHNSIFFNQSIFGGASNLAQGTHVTLIGGYSNTSGSYLAAILGGSGNTANGTGSIILGGIDNITSGIYSIAAGNNTVASGNYSYSNGLDSISYGDYSTSNGYQSIALSSHSYADGYKASAMTFGEWTRSSDGTYGGQYGMTSFTTGTTNNLTTEIFLHTAAGTTPRFVLPTNSIYFVEIVGVASDTATGDAASFKGEGTIKNIAGTTSLINPITMNQIDADGSMVPTTIAATANASTNSLKIDVTGLAGTNINWFVSVKYTRILI